MSNLLQTLVADDFGYKHEGSHWGRAIAHSSLVINESTQRWHWNSEGTYGGVIDYLVKVRGMSQMDAERLSRGTSPHIQLSAGKDSAPVTQYDKLVDLLWSAGKNHRDYWYKRLLTDSTIDRFRLGYYEGWYTVPIYFNSRFLNFQIRRDEPEKTITQWYKGVDKVVFNSDILRLVSTLYLTEGTVDSILLQQYGIPSAAINGVGWEQRWFHLFSNIDTIFYIADNDRAGMEAAKRVCNGLGVYRVKVVTLGRSNKYDTVDFFRDGGRLDDFLNICNTKSKYLFEMEINVKNRFRH